MKKEALEKEIEYYHNLELFDTLTPEQQLLLMELEDEYKRLNEDTD